MKKTITAFVLTVLLVITLFFESCGIIIINGPEGNVSGDTGHMTDPTNRPTRFLKQRPEIMKNTFLRITRKKRCLSLNHFRTKISTQEPYS